MANRMRLIGITELKQQLIGLPAHLGALARPLVDQHVNEAERAIARAYPRRTGQLAAGLWQRVLEDEAARYQVQLRNDVPYAPFVEFGTKHMTGQPIFFPTTREYRRRLAQSLIDLVEAEGLTVTGGASS